VLIDIRIFVYYLYIFCLRDFADAVYLYSHATLYVYKTKTVHRKRIISLRRSCAGKRVLFYRMRKINTLVPREISTRRMSSNFRDKNDGEHPKGAVGKNRGETCGRRNLIRATRLRVMRVWYRRSSIICYSFVNASNECVCVRAICPHAADTLSTSRRNAQFVFRTESVDRDYFLEALSVWKRREKLCFDSPRRSSVNRLFGHLCSPSASA